jgi:hypothetical protein
MRFENIFDIHRTQLSTDETNKYAQQENWKSVNPSTFFVRIMKWEDVIADITYVVLAPFTLMGIVQKPILKIILLTEPATIQVSSFSETSPLETLEVIIKVINFSDNVRILNSKNFQNFSKCIHSPQNNEFQNLYLPNQNTARDRVPDSVERSFVFHEMYTPKQCQIWH